MGGPLSSPRQSWWLIAAPLALLAIRVAQRWNATSVWDDAYMFVRYADEVIATGIPSFYPGGPPTYGLTSIAFLVLAAPMRLLFPGNAVLASLGASTLAGIAFLLVLGRLLYRAADAAPAWRPWLLAGAAIAIAPAAESLAAHFTSGMDTTFALAYLTLFMLVAERRQPAGGGALGAGLLGGLAYSVRPDLVLFTLAVPAAELVFARDSRARVLAARTLAVTFGVIGAQMAVYAWTLGSPVPLAFFLKSASFYGDEIRATYRSVPWAQLGRFAGLHLLLLAALVWAILRDPRSAWSRSTPLDRGLAAGALAFTLYFSCFVLQIMYYAQRFYYPVLPALAFLAVRSVAGALAARPVSLGRRWIAAAALVALVALARPAWLVVRNPGAPLPAAERFDVLAEYRERWRTYWFALDTLSRLSEDLVIATTEVGHPLAMNPRERIVDLAGLNETSLARGGESVDRLIERLRPDVVYLPHPDYVDLHRRLAGDPSFAQAYEVWPAARLGADMGIAILRDGRHASALRAAITSRLASP